MSEDSHLRRALEQPPLKKNKMGKTQENGTMTDQDMLGPCEPGTAINLDGIVWNESKGGLLSLNITWRGKSFMGTLLDCSTSEHASEWASPWTAETEAPNLKPKCYYNKHYMKKKLKMKKKKKKHMPKSDAKILVEPSETDNKKEKAEPQIVNTLPFKLVKCKQENCKKKFTSESALQYHVSFVHAKILAEDDKHVKHTTVRKTYCQKNTTAYSSSYSDLKIEPFQAKDSSDCKDESDEIQSIVCNEEKSIIMQSQTEKKVGLITNKTKSFASTQNFCPIVPVPQTCESSLKPIQPKPMILPGKSVSLCLDDFKKTELSLDKVLSDKFSACTAEEGTSEIDLRQIQTDSLESNNECKQYSREKEAKPFQASEEYVNHIKDFEVTLKSQKNKELNHMNPSFKTQTKKKNTVISIRTEFKTGLTDNLNDNTDQPEILKHTKAGAHIPICQTSHMLPISHSELEFLPQTYFPSFGASPPFNTHHPMLPGLVNIPAKSSSFKLSLESLARAAKEQTRQFRNFSPEHFPEAFSPSHNPTSESSSSDEVALLRHEHMHTHLHYVTSPTHSNN